MSNQQNQQKIQKQNRQKKKLGYIITTNTNFFC